MTPDTKHPGKHRSCAYCGADMGFIEDRYYDRDDTCGLAECNREMGRGREIQRQKEHDEVDRRYNDW